MQKLLLAVMVLLCATLSDAVPGRRGAKRDYTELVSSSSSSSDSPEQMQRVMPPLPPLVPVEDASSDEAGSDTTSSSGSEDDQLRAERPRLAIALRGNSARGIVRYRGKGRGRGTFLATAQRMHHGVEYGPRIKEIVLSFNPPIALMLTAMPCRYADVVACERCFFSAEEERLHVQQEHAYVVRRALPPSEYYDWSDWGNYDDWDNAPVIVAPSF